MKIKESNRHVLMFCVLLTADNNGWKPEAFHWRKKTKKKEEEEKKKTKAESPVFQYYMLNETKQLTVRSLSNEKPHVVSYSHLQMQLKV